MGQVTGCVLQDSRALVKDTHWPGPDPFPHPCLRNLHSMLSAGPAPPLFGWPEEPESPLGPGHLIPSAMTAGQGLGAWP